MALIRKIGIAATASALVFSVAALAKPAQPAVDASQPFLIKDLVPVYVSKSSDIVKVGTEKLIVSYRDLLTRITDPALVAAITARVGDLEMLLQDQLVADAEDHDRVYLADYAKSIAAYQEILRKYPRLETNDQVYYQLAKAYDLGGQGDQSLNALTELITQYPQSSYFVEAQFRRGDYLFSKGRYRDAQSAYQLALAQGADTPFYENTLYMNGWTAFKRNFYEPALENFTGVLDRTMPKNGRIEGVDPAKYALVEDSLRIMGIVFAYMDGGKSIAKTYDRLGRRKYEGLLYEQLADLLVKQQRYKDAIETLKNYIALNPNSPYAPALQNKVLHTMQLGKFFSQSFAEKEIFITNYDLNSNYYTTADEETKAYIRPYLYAYLDEVARFYHARAQQAKACGLASAEMNTNYQTALTYYQKFIESFPDDINVPEKIYMMAEINADINDYQQAIVLYERAAYDNPIHFYSEDAAIASIVAYSKLVSAEQEPEKHKELVDKKLAAQLTLTEKYSFSKYARPVMLDVIDMLYNEKQFDRVIVQAQIFLGMTPEPSAAEQAGVYTALGHSQFELKDYAAAEASYQNALAKMEPNDPRAVDITDRIAGSVYKNAEKLYASEDKEAAIAELLRVAQVAPTSQYRKNAEYDAATYLLEIKSWKKAIDVLTGYRAKYDTEQTDLEVSAKFLIAYEGEERFDLAAQELTRVAALSEEPEKKRQALFLSAEYYEKAGQEAKSLDMYKEYLSKYPQPFDLAMETRFKLSEAYKRLKDDRTYRFWLEEMISADAASGEQSTDRSKYLAAMSKNIFAEDYRIAFESIALTLPLDVSLPRKKEALETVLAKYQEILDYGVQEFTTQATYYVGDIYAQLSKDLIGADRPEGLDELAMEQYTILLEEEAYPFEEKAIEIHESNVMNSKAGFYDKWVSKSIDSLAKLQPGRYNKKEIEEGYNDAYY